MSPLPAPHCRLDFLSPSASPSPLALTSPLLALPHVPSCATGTPSPSPPHTHIEHRCPETVEQEGTGKGLGACRLTPRTWACHALTSLPHSTSPHSSPHPFLPDAHPTSGHPALHPTIPGGEETAVLCHGAPGGQLPGSCEYLPLSPSCHLVLPQEEGNSDALHLCHCGLPQGFPVPTPLGHLGEESQGQRQVPAVEGGFGVMQA